jgi:tetrapyrrole methylase family protein / MazG family protein
MNNALLIVYMICVNLIYAVYIVLSMTTFKELVELMAYMRGPDGCPWDREQTLADFKKHFRNESKEVLDALKKEDMENLKEELGDILWHILFMSEIANERGLFTVDDVMDGLKDKIVRRHPHIFREKRKLTSEEVLAEWGAIKAKERKKGRAAISVH